MINEDDVILKWWNEKTEDSRRVMVRKYFTSGDSENINTLSGIMLEEIKEIYLQNII